LALAEEVIAQEAARIGNQTLVRAAA
jgi:hypothetical protein